MVLGFQGVNWKGWQGYYFKQCRLFMKAKKASGNLKNGRKSRMQQRRFGMEQDERELTEQEKRKIKSLVEKICANYDKEHGCLPLDCECYMLSKWWTGCLCKYFETVVLPSDPLLKRVLLGDSHANTKPCAMCGKRFVVAGRKLYCSDKCRETGQRQKDAKRARRYRLNKMVNVTI